MCGQWIPKLAFDVPKVHGHDSAKIRQRVFRGSIEITSGLYRREKSQLETSVRDIAQYRDPPLTLFEVLRFS
jgi:hypothetical protein